MKQEDLDIKEVSLTYDVKALNEILIALGEVPFGKVNHIIAGMHQQVQPQIDVYIKEWNAANPEEKVQDAEKATDAS